MNPAPWWGVPVIAGAFLLTGALIAFLSTSVSDRRKLKREDRRQWDKEIRDAYLEITRQLDVITGYRYQAIPEEERRARYEAGATALAAISRQVVLLDLIGTPLLAARASELEYRCSEVVASWHDLINPGKALYRALNGARGELLHAIKDSIRVQRYKPYIRPPMTLTTRSTVYVRGKLRSLRNAVRDRLTRRKP